MVQRTAPALLLLALVAGLPLQARAQEDEADYAAEGLEPEEEGEGGSARRGEADRAVKVSAFVFTEQEVDERVATEAVAALRRGIRSDPRLQWVDPSRALASEDSEDFESPAVEQARQRVFEAYELAGAGRRWRDVTRLLDDALEVFEANLVQVRRTTLVDAFMLWGAAQCMLRRERACESAFRRVLTFRESAEWDPRLPVEVEEVFEGVRDEVLAGPRGSIRIESFPVGAEVFVDGRFVGAAPTRAEGLLAGDHYISLKRLGYRRHVERVTVETDFEETVTLELVQLGNEPLLRQATEAARREMGQTRAGDGMHELWSLLFMDQLILGDLRRVGDTDSFDLTLYLYDLRTRHGLNRIERRLDWQVMDLSRAEELVSALYRDVDLSGRIRPVDAPLPARPREREPFFRTWWFWSIVGAVVVGTTIGVASAVTPQEPAGAHLLLPH